MRRTRQQARETRDHILDAAERLFAEQGVSRTSLEDIALRAGCTRGAIYGHFRNKGDLFVAMTNRVMLPMEMLVAATADPAEVWRTMLMSLGSWALRGYGMWACEKIDGEVFIGSVGVFHPLDWPEPEIAYALDQPFWGQGYASEAADAACRWLFSHFPLDRVASFIRPDNVASQRVATRLGAVREGTVELRGNAYEWWVHRRPAAI